MLKLNKAFKMCRIKDEMIYLRARGKSSNSMNNHGFWSSKLIKILDLSSIEVLNIEMYSIGYENWSGPYWLFVVDGITDEQLGKLEYKLDLI